MTDIDDLLARADAALEGITPGPWSVHSIGSPGEEEPSSIAVHTGVFDWEDLSGEANSAVAFMPRWDRQEDVNARFIAAAPEMIRELADEVRRLAVARERASTARYENAWAEVEDLRAVLSEDHIIQNREGS